MKTRSFAVDLFLLASILFSASCAAPTPTASPTPPVTQTLSPTATQTTIPTETLTPTETPVPAEFIDLKIVSEVEYINPQGLANISIKLDESMIFKGVDEVIKNENFPGGADAAMAKFAQHFFWKVAIKTNENAKGLTYEEYVDAWRKYKEDPTNNEAKAKIEFTFFNDVTGQMETHTPMNLEFVFGGAKKLEGLHTYLEDHIDGLRIEYNNVENKLVYISGFGDVTEVTSYKDFGADLARAANYLIKYKGKNLTNFNYTNIDESLRGLFVTSNGRVAFKILKNGKPASDKEAELNP